MPYQIKLYEGYPDNKQVDEICNLTFGEDAIPIPFLEDHLKHQKKILCCFAYDGEVMVGDKIGYQSRPKYFESWIGAISTEHRRKGLATKLMIAQHDWCAAHGFKIIDTIASSDNRPMLIANLKAGFNISGTFWDRQQNFKTLLQKNLDINKS